MADHGRAPQERVQVRDMARRAVLVYLYGVFFVGLCRAAHRRGNADHRCGRADHDDRFRILLRRTPEQATGHRHRHCAGRPCLPAVAGIDRSAVFQLPDHFYIRCGMGRLLPVRQRRERSRRIDRRKLHEGRSLHPAHDALPAFAGEFR